MAVRRESQVTRYTFLPDTVRGTQGSARTGDLRGAALSGGSRGALAAAADRARGRPLAAPARRACAPQQDSMFTVYLRVPSATLTLNPRPLATPARRAYAPQEDRMFTICL